MDLQTFLLTANPDHNVALEEAKAYTTTEGRFITSNTLTVYVVQLGLYSVFNDIANTTGHSARDICMAVMDRLRGVSDFNFIIGSPMGDANFSLLDSLISLLPDKANQLNTLKSLATDYCNRISYPFANTTLHNVLIERNAVTLKPLSYDGQGYAYIVTTGVCEKHNPRLLAKNPRTEQIQSINNFREVAAVGTYDAIVPRQFAEWELFVDDVYGVIQ